MIESIDGLRPQVHPTAYVHRSATLIGDVVVGPRASVWPGAVLRGDHGRITIGADTNIQDGVVAHADRGRSEVWVGPRVTVGHRVTLHGCRIEGDALIGMNAVILDHAVIGSGCVIGALALVTAGKQLFPRSLYMGVPARRVREISDSEFVDIIQRGCEEYLRLVELYGARDRANPA